jgi:hypothetical protein
MRNVAVATATIFIAIQKAKRAAFRRLLRRLEVGPVKQCFWLR